MATQVVIDISEYEELKACKGQVQQMINERLRFTEEKTKELEIKYQDKYQDRCQILDTWIEHLNRKEWVILFTGWNKRRTGI